MALFGIEYRVKGGSKWHRCSLTMHDRKAIEQNATELAKQEGWREWRVVPL